MLHTNRSIVTFIATAALVATAACSSSDTVSAPSAPSGPTGGWLTVELTTPRNDDGAVQFAITGPAVDSVTVLGYDGFGVAAGTEADFVITGDVTNGVVARVHVPDLSVATAYQATVAAAAARTTFALQPLNGYRAVLVR